MHHKPSQAPQYLKTLGRRFLRLSFFTTHITPLLHHHSHTTPIKQSYSPYSSLSHFYPFTPKTPSTNTYNSFTSRSYIILGPREMASQAAVANSASFQQDSALVARYAADRRGRAMSVSSQASEASMSEEETAYSSGYGSGVATPVPTPNPTTIEPPPTKPHKYVRREGVTIPATERSPLLARRSSTERYAHARRDDQTQEQEWTWWDEFKILSSYVLPVYGYVIATSALLCVSLLTVRDTGPTSLNTLLTSLRSCQSAISPPWHSPRVRLAI